MVLDVSIDRTIHEKTKYQVLCITEFCLSSLFYGLLVASLLNDTYVLQVCYGISLNIYWYGLLPGTMYVDTQLGIIIKMVRQPATHKGTMQSKQGTQVPTGTWYSRLKCTLMQGVCESAPESFVQSAESAYSTFTCTAIQCGYQVPGTEYKGTCYVIRVQYLIPLPCR